MYPYSNVFIGYFYLLRNKVTLSFGYSAYNDVGAEENKTKLQSSLFYLNALSWIKTLEAAWIANKISEEEHSLLSPSLRLKGVTKPLAPMAFSFRTNETE